MTDKPELWQFWVNSSESAHFVCPYWHEIYGKRCEFYVEIDNYNLTELHAIAREHWAKEHNNG